VHHRPSADRFTYWVDRIDDGGEVLATGDPTDPVQFIDVRDLAEFYVHLLENDTPGVFNAEGPEASLSSAALLHGIRAVTNTPVSFTWVEWDFLFEQDVLPSRDLPFWQPPRGRYLNYGRMNNRRAIAAGLRFRPLAETAKDTLDWHRTRSPQEQEQLRAGIPRQREAELLAAWRAR
jgi:2'-hydroxyisoflavone reductase